MPLRPLTVLRLKRLWPQARKHGHEIGQIYRVGYYCKNCGLNVIWLVDSDGTYDWTADQEFVDRFFEIVEPSRERSLYGKNRPKLGKLDGSKNLQGKPSQLGRSKNRRTGRH
jgi:hypothetical protein